MGQSNNFTTANYIVSIIFLVVTILILLNPLEMLHFTKGGRYVES